MAEIVLVLRARALALSVLALFFFAGAALAADVTDGGDDVAVAGSLRHAVQNASSGDDIDFDSDVDIVTIQTGNGTIEINVTDLRIVGNIDPATGKPATAITSSGTPDNPIDFPIFSGGVAGNGLTLENLVFKDIHFSYDSNDLYGAIVSFTRMGGAVSLGALTNTIFTGNSATFSGYLYGGGLVGAETMIGDIGAGSAFTLNKIDIDDALEGGGLVGAWAFSADVNASIGNLGMGVAFTGNEIDIDDGLDGGGLVGVYANGSNGNASIGNVGADAAITENNVAVRYLYGGGLLGAYSNYGKAKIGDMGTDVVFEKNTVKLDSSLDGGGLVGAWSQRGSAEIGDIGKGSLFSENVVEATEGGSFWGGGLVGASVRDNDTTDVATIGDIGEGVVFRDNTVISTDSESTFEGGGLLGVRSQGGEASIGDIGAGAVFTGNKVNSRDLYDGDGEGELGGGGLLGAVSFNGDVTIGAMGEDVAFTDNVITVGGLEGGGLVGVTSVNGNAAIGDIGANASFTGNEVTASGSLYGGGMVGANASYGEGALGNIGAGAAFSGNKIEAGSLIGGGLVGARAYAEAVAIGTVAGNFSNNEITVGVFLWGGGVLGVYKDETGWTDSMSVTFGDLNGAVFADNRITVGEKANAAYSESGVAQGGVIGVTGLNQTWTITDAAVTGNTLDIYNHGGLVYAGTIYIGADRETDNNSHDVVVTGNSVFSGNSVSYYSDANKSSLTETRANSFHFGSDLHWDGVTLSESKADASLTLAPQTGETVKLLDPISVDMNDEHSAYGFSFTIGAAPSGTVELDGENRIDAGGGGAFTANSGALVLHPEFTLNHGDGKNGGALAVTLDNSSDALSLTVHLKERDQALAMFENPDSFDVAAGSNGITVSVGDRSFSTNSISGEWLVTENPDGEDGSSFVMANPSSNLAFLLKDDGWLYISGSIGGAPDNVQNNPNPNVQSSFNSGGLSDAWDAAKKELGLEPDSPAENSLFDRIAANPQKLTAEPIVSRGMAALDSAADIWSGVRGIAGLHAPGGWNRDAELTVNPDSGNAAGQAYGSYVLDRPVKPRTGVWAGSFANRSDTDGHGGFSGYDGRLRGAAVGATHTFGQALRAGAYLAYGRDKNTFDRLGAEIKAHAYQAGLFADLRFTSRWGVRLDLSHTWFDNRLDHDAPAGHYRADFDQRVFALGFETGYDFLSCDGRTRLTPFANLRWQHLSQDATRERARSGAPHAMASTLRSLTADSLVGSLGFEVARDIRFPGAGVGRLQPSLRAAWSHELGDRQASARAGYGSLAPSYRATSYRKSRDRADLSAALTARFRETSPNPVALTLGVDASFGRRYSEYGFQVGATVGF